MDSKDVNDEKKQLIYFYKIHDIRKVYESLSPNEQNMMFFNSAPSLSNVIYLKDSLTYRTYVDLWYRDGYFYKTPKFNKLKKIIFNTSDSKHMIGFNSVEETMFDIICGKFKITKPLCQMTIDNPDEYFLNPLFNTLKSKLITNAETIIYVSLAFAFALYKVVYSS